MLQTGIFRVLVIAIKSREKEFLIARQALLCSPCAEVANVVVGL